MDALLYKIQNDPYYCDVQVDYNALDELPEIATNVSNMSNFITLPEIDNDIEFAVLEGTFGIDDVLEGLNTSSFATKLLNLPQEIELI